jgi:hypothetical protein
MRILLTVLLFGLSFTFVSTSPMRQEKYDVLVKDMPSAKRLINQNKQCDLLIQEIDAQLEAVDMVENQVDSLTDTLENKTTLRRLKRVIKREAIAQGEPK